MKIKKIVVILILLTLIVSITSNVYAAKKSIWETGKEWLSVGEDKKNEVYGSGEDMKDPVLDIAGILMGIGIFIAVGVGIILGIKFMFSTAEGKAEISKLLVPYLIGIMLVVGALGVWKLAIGIVDI